jgi:hypothetical protein
MSYAELLISNQLCFLVYRLHLAISAHYRPLLRRFGLTYGQYLAMLALWEHRKLPVGELCRVLGARHRHGLPPAETPGDGRACEARSEKG